MKTTKATAAATFLFLAFNTAALDNKFNNRISLGVDQTFSYQRQLPFYFRIGTELNYKMKFGSDSLPGSIHFDQQPTGWLFVLSHQFQIGKIDLGNQVKLMSDRTPRSVEISTYISKRFEMEDRWGIVPSVDLIQYSYDPSNLGTGKYRYQVHDFGIMTNLRLEVAFDF